MEVIDTVNDLISVIKTFNVNFINELIPLINKYDVYFNYEKDKNNLISRIILRIRKNNNIHSLLYYYCNGCVIDTINWKVISYPPIAFNKRQVPNLIETYYKQGYYDIIKVIDGTVVTIYFWNDRWNISSSNSYDISSFYWIGNMTYSEIIYDLFTRLYPEASKKCGIQLHENVSISFTNLDKNKSYTIGFRHHNFHPLLKDPEYLWNIQHVDINTGKIEYDNGFIGIPNQKIINGATSLDQLRHLNKSALIDATKTSDPTFNYGYILRSKDPSITLDFSNILLSSSLLKKIKKNIYECSLGSLTQFITHENRFEYITLKNFFNKSERNEIVQLYPQLFQKFPLYCSCISDTISCTLDIMKNKQTGSNNKLDYQTCIITLAYSLIKYISKFEALDPYHKDTELILNDYYSNIEYSVLFINAISKYKYKSN